MKMNADMEHICILLILVLITKKLKKEKKSTPDDYLVGALVGAPVGGAPVVGLSEGRVILVAS